MVVDGKGRSYIGEAGRAAWVVSDYRADACELSDARSSPLPGRPRGDRYFGVRPGRRGSIGLVHTTASVVLRQGPREPEEALAYAEMVDAGRQARARPRTLRRTVATTLHVLAVASANLGKYGEAEHHYERALRMPSRTALNDQASARLWTLGQHRRSCIRDSRRLRPVPLLAYERGTSPYAGWTVGDERRCGHDARSSISVSFAACASATV